MPIYSQAFEYTTHAIGSVSHTLKVAEEVDIPNNGSYLTFSIIRNNSSNVSTGGKEKLTVKVNGETLIKETVELTPAPPAYSSDEVLSRTVFVSHNQSGGGDFTAEVIYQCDCVEDNSGILFLPEIYYTYAKAKITKSFTKIYQTYPQINNVLVKADRYGLNASASFVASHQSYPISKIKFILSDLNNMQSLARIVSKINGADTSERFDNFYETGETTYRIELTKHLNLSDLNDIVFNLDDEQYKEYPLSSGKTYSWEINVTALNGKTQTIKGLLKVPQKVTGVTCVSQIETSVSENIELDYQVEPFNAEYPAVTFTSSDPSVATVNSEGIITAKEEGICQITVTTLDGGSADALSGFSAVCTVYVVNENAFPKLQKIRFLTPKEISKIVFACKFLHDKLVDKGTSVDDLLLVECKGKNHPVKDIKPLLELIESNCQKLKSASSKNYPTSSLANNQTLLVNNDGSNWFIVVNEWIDFLNELNSLL